MGKTAIAVLFFAAIAAQAAPPETVMVTYRAKKGSEAQLADVLAKHWATVQRLQLGSGERQLYRAGSTFIEIFTWKDADIPDNAPPEIRALWTEMNNLVEKNGLSILQVERVSQ